MLLPAGLSEQHSSFFLHSLFRRRASATCGSTRSRMWTCQLAENRLPERSRSDRINPPNRCSYVAVVRRRRVRFLCSHASPLYDFCDGPAIAGHDRNLSVPFSIKSDSRRQSEFLYRSIKKVRWPIKIRRSATSPTRCRPSGRARHATPRHRPGCTFPAQRHKASR